MLIFVSSNNNIIKTKPKIRNDNNLHHCAHSTYLLPGVQQQLVHEQADILSPPP